MLTAFGECIGRRNANCDSSFNIGIAKDMRETEKVVHLDTIGFFVNTLVVPFEAQKPNFEVGKIEELIEKISNHSMMIYEDLCKISGKDSLFDVMFVVDNEEVSKMGQNRNFEIFNNYPSHTKFELTVIVKPNGKDVDIRVEYMKSLYHEETIESLLNEWCCVLKRMFINQPKFPFNSTIAGERCDFPKNMQIFEMLQNQTILLPQNMAFLSHAQKLTYTDFWFKIRTFVQILCEQFFLATGRFLAPDDIIPIVSTSSIETIILCIAVIFTGAAYLPIDATNPRERTRGIIEAVNLDFYIADEEIDGLKAFWSSNENLHILVKKFSVENKNVKVHSKNVPEDLAYVIYTSGTTGKPKGVPIQRLGLMNMIADSTKFFFMQPSDVVYQFTNFCFDNSVLEIFMALANGASMVKSSEQFMSDTFIKDLEKFKITHALLFPGVVETFSDEELEKMNQLRYWIVGAEKLPKTLLEKAINLGTRVIQNYGPTETTAYILRKRMKKNDDPQNLGRPIQNADVFIRDKSGGRASKMVLGEILLSSVGLFRGYIGKSEQPFVEMEDGKKYYFSGDLGRILPSNETHFSGRKDSQIKIRGFRVECSEIESILSKHPNIKSSKVIYRSTKTDLVAYVLVHDPQIFDSSLIKNYCKQHLPHYMIPRFVQLLNEFPLTANSKLDMKKLPDPEIDLPPKKVVEIETQENLVIAKIVKIWKEELNIEEISEEDDFFYLGGNSLNGQRIVAKINQILGCRLNLKELYENPNVKKLAEILNIDDIHTKNVIEEKFSFSQIGSENHVPLSFQQEQMLYLYQLGTTNAYNLPFVQEFSLDLNPKILHAAFHLLLEQNPSLRTIFLEENYETYQKVLPLTETFHAFEIEDLPSSKIADAIQQFWLQKFDLSQKPPVRVRLFRTEKNYVVVLVLHHIISDAFSTQIIEQEISEIYDKLYKKEKFEIKNKKTYAAWSLEQKSEEGLIRVKRKLDAFKKEMGIYLENRVEIFNIANLENLGQSQGYDLFISNQKISSICKNCQTSPFILFCTVISRALCTLEQIAKLPDEKYFFLGAPVANRTIETGEIVGNFLNNLLIHCPTFLNSLSNEEAIQRMHEIISKSMKFFDLPYITIQEAIREMGLNYANLFQVYINCRYGLENEQSLKMDEAVKSMEHFTLPIKDLIEVDIDRLEENFKIRVRIQNGLMSENEKKKFLGVIKEFFEDKPKESATQDAIKEAICLTLPVNLVTENLKPQDNFFFLGGNSILLLKLRRILNEKFGIKLELSEILKSPTIEGLENLIKLQISTKIEVVHELGVNKNPNKILIFFHPLIGGCVSYSLLINQLKQQDKNLCIYGVEHPETFKTDANFSTLVNNETLEELVKFYLKHLEKKIRLKNEEVIFIGASFGGLLAYEAASQAYKNGLKLRPTKVICIDGTAKPYENVNISKEEHFEQMKEILSNFGFNLDEHEAETSNQIIENSWQNLQISLKYYPKPILKETICFSFMLLKAKSDRHEPDDYGWRQLVKTKMFNIPGDHFTMFDSNHSEELAKIILQSIN